MSEETAAKHVLLLTAAIMAFFGAIVAAWSLIARARGQSSRATWVRYLAWFAILPPIVIPLAYSRIGFQIAVLVLSLMCFREYARATGLWRDRKLVFGTSLAILAIYFPVFDRWYGLYQAVPIYALAFVLFIPIRRDEYEHMIQKVCLSVFGVMYFGWFLSHVAYLRNVDHGIASILFLLVIVESNDAFAYLWGKLLGRHKLSPRISPNKTIEGFVGALLSVIALGLVMRYLMPFMSVFHVVLLSFMLSLFGVCGDLTISYIKRDLGIKDTGDLIPGHGGVLDRFDSLLFAAPLYFHFLRYFYGHVGHGW